MPEGRNSGVLLVDLEGAQLTAEEEPLLLLESIAGVVLFSRNYQSRDQLISLTSEIRKLRPDILICVDQEGGRVQRFLKGFTRLPPAMAYSQYDQHLQQEIALESGWLMASELLACGVDLCLGPVLDIDHGRTDILENRAFGHSHEQVVKLASPWIDGVHDAGMSVVIKHFPGHGNVDDDSHLSLPVDERSFELIEQTDLQTFKAMIDRGGVEAVMPAHILFPAIDEVPVGFSSKWLQTILRSRLRYDGLIMSDCLSMEGAAALGGYSERAQAALEAGCDLLIVCDRQGVLDVLKGLKPLKLKGRGPSRLMPAHYPDWEQLVSSSRYQDIQQLLINSAHHC